jgi:hypothetical protein
MTPPDEIMPGWNHEISPDNYDRQAAAIKGLLDENGFNDKFFYIQALYHKGLDSMLVEKLQLQRHDKNVRDFGFYQVVPYESDIFPYWKLRYYQSLSMMNLNYFYIRNNIYVERLAMEDLAVFERGYEASEVNVSEDMLETIIELTWKSVISVHPDGSSAPRGYGFDKQTTTDALVLEIGIEDEELHENETEEDRIHKVEKQ